ncbi:MAG: hydroxysqualene dehydroxylase HpnE [Rhodocyclaceae bacterium]|nr:hydroxysqualene dehydroxylase HpnE [Rhodocyclaceae bacterium]
MNKKVAIVGAGYAGMAAAVALVDAGHDVTVFETSRVLGGRARKVAWDGLTIDNGQHILIGAYRDTLALLRRIGVDETQALLRLPLTLNYPQFSLRAPRLPAPLHLAAALLTARGLAWGEKLSAIRFMQWLEKRHFQLDTDRTVKALLDEHAQAACLRRYLWEPLCIAALNTPTEAASAQVFANVLRDSLAADRAASDLLIPRVDLSALLPEPAARYIQARGGKLRLGAAVGGIRRDKCLYKLDAEPDVGYDAVIVAVAPHHLGRLLAELPELTPLRTQIDAMASEPIATCYLQYPPDTRLPHAMQGLADGYAHWVFDRGQLDGTSDKSSGLIAAVISARGKHQALDKDALAAAIDAELRAVQPSLPAFVRSQVITEKRATFACTPGMLRPAAQTALPGLLLAGDYVASDYPATIEGAVRSGLNAAALIV